MKYKTLIIVATYSTDGGSEIILDNLLAGIDKEKYNIDILAITQYSLNVRKNRDKVRMLSPFAASNSRLYWWKRDALQYILCNKPQFLSPLFNNIFGNYDIVIAWAYQQPTLFLISLTNKIKIAWCHNDINDIISNGNNIINKQLLTAYMKAYMKAYMNTDIVVTVSNAAGLALSRMFPQIDNKIRVINNPCDAEKIQELAYHSKQIEIPDHFNKNIILAVGRLDKNKNIELIIRAVSKSVRSGIECFLIIVGDGNLKNDLVTLVKQEYIERYVFFTGYVKNPYPYFKIAKVLCLSSFREGFANVVLEAMTFGIPFVTTPVAGASDELSANQQCGLISDWNIGDYSECIIKLLTDDTQYEQMSKNCIQESKKYSVENFITQFEDTITGIENTKDENDSHKTHFNFYSRFSAILWYAYAFATKKTRSKYINNLFIIVFFPLFFFLGFLDGIAIGAKYK
ncbi:glycosyl transferase [Spirochaetia bacterium]|nr:glycosyl transferase [Spirochaetia bacterium]